MKLEDMLKAMLERLKGKHQTVQRSNPAGTKLAKYFAKARSRAPRGY